MIKFSLHKIGIGHQYEESVSGAIMSQDENVPIERPKTKSQLLAP